MTEFYRKSNQTESEPQLQRARQRYRGPRNSERINLEAAQFLYDVSRIHERLNNVQTDFKNALSLLANGGTTVHGESLRGVENLAADIIALEKRIRMLENR